MVQMDLAEDVDRAGTAARTIRTLKNIEEESSEEFVGYADVVDSESEDEAEGVFMLKVRTQWNKCQMLVKYLHYQTGDQQSTSKTTQSPQSAVRWQ